MSLRMMKQIPNKRHTKPKTATKKQHPHLRMLLFYFSDNTLPLSFSQTSVRPFLSLLPRRAKFPQDFPDVAVDAYALI